MSFINNCSHECTKGELDLFLLPETQCSVESADYVYYKPISSLKNNAPIEFQIPASGDEYIDVGDTFLHVVASIRKVSRRRRKTKKRKVQRKRKPVKRHVRKKKKKRTARTTCRKKKGVCKKKRTATNSFKDIFS
ncbi:hypothetical protein B566_EDAN012645 [Ephemera danica]|nr:hypothetical protein B566_EDAN012645 [Ephemera danica]